MTLSWLGAISFLRDHATTCRWAARNRDITPERQKRMLRYFEQLQAEDPQAFANMIGEYIERAFEAVALTMEAQAECEPTEPLKPIPGTKH